MLESNLFEYLVNSLWQLPLLVAATWLVLRVTRPTLLIQHALWIATLAAAVVLPMRGLGGSSRGGQQSSDPVEANFPAGPPISFYGTSRPHDLLAVRVHPLNLRPRTVDWLIELYGVSIAFSLARLVRSYFAARQLITSSSAHPLTTLETALVNACATRLQLVSERVPALRFLADRTTSPMVIGFRHPILLLPEHLRPQRADEFDARAFTAVLLHEFTHVRRRDYLANLVAHLASIPIAYHPATSAIEHRIRQTREMICDEHAADACHSSAGYARSLLTLAEGMLHAGRNVQAVGLFHHSRIRPQQDLEERIMNLTAQKLPISFALRRARAAAGSMVLVAASATAATFHLKPAMPLMLMAQVQQPAPLPVPQTAPAPTPLASSPQPSPAPDPHPAIHVRVVSDAKPTLMPQGRQQVRQQARQAQQQAEQQLNDAAETIRAATAQLSDPAFQKQLAESLDAAKSTQVEDLQQRSAQIEQQMAQIQARLKVLATPEMRQQMLVAQRSAAQAALKSAEVRRQMDQLRSRMSCPEIQRQIEDATREAAAAMNDANERAAAARRQSDEMHQSLENLRRQIQESTGVTA
jgi:beta-lactamase regulating signal transducer with metallopeptidase domain